MTISQKLFQRYSESPATFRDDLIIDVDGAARRFGDCMDDWQRADFLSIDAALMRCNGRAPDAAAKMRAYLERPRGHSKTSDLAVLSVWALAFAARPLKGYAYAADKDQAGLLKQAVETILRLNPWLGSILTVEAHRVVNHAKGHPGQGATLSIEASDVGSSYGILPDLIIADELVHWQGDGSLWHSLISSAAKRESCLLVVISNAGFADSWQWLVREAARTDEAWLFSRLDGPKASWLPPKRLAEQSRLLPAITYMRLWENIWSASGGDALRPADIAAAFIEGLQPMQGNEPGYAFVGGLDLGLVRDFSAFVILGVPDSGMGGKIRLAHHRVWKPKGDGSKLNIGEIEQHILAMDSKYRLQFVGFDPWQAEHLSQRLEQLTEHRRRKTEIYQPLRPRGIAAWMRPVPPTASNLREIAGLVIESFSDRRFSFYPCEPLRRDLLKLRAEEKSYGIRLVSPRDGEGHGDCYSAFSNALLIGHEVAGKKRVVAGVGDVTGRTAEERARARFQSEALALNRRAERLNQPNPNNEPFVDFMRRNAPRRLS